MTAPGKIIPLLILVLPFIQATRLPGQEVQPPPVLPGDGLQAFRQLLDYENLQPIESIAAFRQLSPVKTLVIILGSTAPGKEIWQQAHALRNFTLNGGAVLIASFEDRALLEDLLLEIPGELVTEKDSGFHGKSACPILSIPSGKAAEHPIMKGVTKSLATNCPSFVIDRHIQVPPGEFRRPILFFSKNARSIFGDDPLPYAYASITRERFLILAGEGIFRNGMMIRMDTDNFIFAWNCIRWLKGSRTHALLFEDGEIVTNFDGPLSLVQNKRSLPKWNPIPIFETMLSQAEKDDVFNKQLARIPRVWILRVALILGTAVLVLWARRRLGAARHHLETEAPLVDVAVAQARGDLPALSLRHRAQVNTNNYGELAQALARQFLDEHLPGVHTASSYPAVDVAAGWWTRRRLQKQMCLVWDLAHGSQATRVSGRRLQTLLTTLHDLAAAVDAGILSIRAAVAA